MEIDEESNIAYKEGPGKITRGRNTCYYRVLKGNWLRGLFHGRQNKIVMNLAVFPKGYLTTNPTAKALSFEGHVTNGCWLGPASIIVDNKLVCKTQFYDLFEVMQSRRHPVG